MQEAPTGVVISRVQSETPAERAGLAVGDVVVGVGGEPVRNVADFYRKIWSKGDAGVEVGLDLVAPAGRRSVSVTTGDRRRYMRGGRSY